MKPLDHLVESKSPLPDSHAEPIRVLIVDDEAMVREVLTRALRQAGCDAAQAAGGAEALCRLDEAQEAGLPFHVLLTDIQMPGLRGDDLLRRVRTQHPHLTVVLLSAITDTDLAVSFLKDGAADYITKPFLLGDVVVRVRKASARMQGAGLAESVSGPTLGELPQRALRSLTPVCEALEARDPYRREHALRVGRVAQELIAHLHPGPVSHAQEAFAANVMAAARVLDIGFVALPEGLLLKSDPLAPEERERIRRHTALGRSILEPLFDDGEVPRFVYHHHEHWDGGGYPDGLKGEAIPRGARLLAVADAYAALTASRPHRPALSPEQALEVFRRGAGRQWDPALVTALEELHGSNNSGARTFPSFSTGASAFPASAPA